MEKFPIRSIDPFQFYFDYLVILVIYFYQLIKLVQQTDQFDSMRAALDADIHSTKQNIFHLNFYFFFVALIFLVQIFSPLKGIQSPSPQVFLLIYLNPQLRFALLLYYSLNNKFIINLVIIYKFDLIKAMNSDSNDSQQNDHYNVDSYNPKKKEPSQIIYKFSKPIKKPDLKQMLEPIPSKLLFPYQEQLDTGQFLYSNKEHLFKQDKRHIVFLCFHGAGHSAHVFGHLAKQIKKQPLFAYDIMCHGKSKSKLKELDMNISVLVNQGIQVLKHIANKWGFTHFVLVGHSLGGSIATRVAHKIQTSSQLSSTNIVGVVMIDTIQGSAKRSTPEMINFLKQRPPTFQSIESAIKWNYKAGCVRRLEAARFSVPSFFIPCNNNRYKWKTDLISTIHLWEQWFNGLSAMFSLLQCSKVLLTSSKYRLDQILLQSLGKELFNLELFDYSGHNIQEDEYQKVAKILNKYFDKKNKQNQ